MEKRKLLEAMFHAAVKAADPTIAVPAVLPPRPDGRVIVVGCGKASAAMAVAVEKAWGPCEGLVIVNDGAKLPTQQIELVEASHPVPDARGTAAAHRICDMVSGLTDKDTVLFLISGGGSSLMPLPADGLTLEEKQQVTKALLHSGAAIDEMNTVRAHLSKVKGGKLARLAQPARCITLMISDVPGDNPAHIASGPTASGAGSAAEALEIIDRYGIDLAPNIRAVIESSEVPADVSGELHMIATPQKSLEAAAQVARDAGVTPLILGDAIEGEARVVGKVMAGIAKQVVQYGQPASAPCVLISGGETTVTVGDRIPGKGGRNSEGLLSFALTCWDEPHISAIFCDTDGRDGSEDNAGAIWLPEFREELDSRTAREFLTAHDAYSYFAKVDGLVETGPTHTNVNDFRAVLIEA
ncbi:glycerate kinase type-2 family protein [Qingshengfaniella alkalisoli]|uniref:Glycerate kinase n=1 Tax=Qingshengfaniella alkalisoli TaxID=2599296 RepID=A0A5B8ID52_9RHOB|nr:glycerate kinase [Qingshengfaniella alkalisoli]QDY71576.1 glycerate kinase [Qingshengfaniella alkalisoli]